MSTQYEDAVKSLSASVMFGTYKKLADYGLEYRTGKGGEDIKTAVRKAKKNGRQKIEFELSMLECYLGNIVKVARAKKEGEK